MSLPRSILTVIHAHSEAEGRALMPPERPGWKRQVEVEEHPGLCYRWRIQVTDLEEKK